MTEAQTRVDPTTLENFTDKRVSLTFQRIAKATDGEAEGLTYETVTQEGRVEMGAAIGLMFKEKGKSNVQLIEADDIVDVAELASREPKVTVKTLQPVAVGRVRQHLADRHGWTLEQANGLSESQAVSQHDAIDHSVLGHKHEVPQAEAEAAPVEAAPVEAVDTDTDEGVEAGE